MNGQKWLLVWGVGVLKERGWVDGNARPGGWRVSGAQVSWLGFDWRILRGERLALGCGARETAVQGLIPTVSGHREHPLPGSEGTSTKGKGRGSWEGYGWEITLKKN